MNVLKPYDSCSRRRVAEGSPSQEENKNIEKPIRKAYTNRLCGRHKKTSLNEPKRGCKIHQKSIKKINEKSVFFLDTLFLTF